MAFQDVVFWLLGFYYRVFSRIDYKDSQASKSASRKLIADKDGPVEDQAQPLALSSADRLALDQFQITSLLKNERYHRDCRQWQNLRNCYHPSPSKTRIQVGAFQGNIDGFMNLSQMSSPPGLRILHLVDAVDVEIRGSKAVAVGIDTTLNRFEHQGSEFELTSISRTVSRVEKIDGKGWKICSWETIYNRDSLAPVDPSTAMPAIGEVGKGRKSYRHLAWFISQKGVKMPANLAGDDDPSTVGRVLKEAQEWLKNES
ncbi:hypothetical protein BJ170DRAFT_697069 [Xylariales sp. AK1849]|nr:hypothetical protein BJ170DRAFT_697069 [Xylariales sp. AK1849]